VLETSGGSSGLECPGEQEGRWELKLGHGKKGGEHRSEYVYTDHLGERDLEVAN
jgi:hypothetical protein